MAWINLFVAAMFEVGWMFSLKFLSFEKIRGIRWNVFFQNTQGIATLIPLLAYILLGFANVYFLALAMKHISTSVAFAVWTGVSLIGVKVIEMTVYKQPYSIREFLFFALILIGIIGLKRTA